MNISLLLSVRLLWLLIAVFNFAVQMAYYFNDRSRRLFLAKKVTTPLLLFSGLVIVMASARGFPLMPCAVLLAMGLGELGIEGSSVVESKEGDKTSGGVSGIVVLLAGVLFLLVNVFIGLWLIFSRGASASLTAASLAAVLIIAVMMLVSFRLSKPEPSIRTQMILYSIGLAVLLSGVIYDATGGLSQTGLAALILMVSDSLVLIRMGAGLDKKSRSGRRSLLVFLIVILLLYYFYMWLLISIGVQAA